MCAKDVGMSKKVKVSTLIELGSHVGKETNVTFWRLEKVPVEVRTPRSDLRENEETFRKKRICLGRETGFQVKGSSKYQGVRPWKVEGN